ncbi:hypothetical protein QYC27_08440 [Thermosynechococcus sp. PP45]|uniref:hypothetical protein n=1 Tax=unclassified Thermosynechococcus TaxID=2622553 RepID=UPI00267268C6|nr:MULTISPECIES: hypothetical protein [unclassified Thermosynechococcus]WKT80324.1 hypothetical protein QYC27_08440 [Thermosynechococcus sp. PP45]WNC23935.1 hypothetical protein RHH26_08435 [Thermosynechococcus sp. PP551]WNC26512.1 hypothetical protein RHH27_08430 [Thermosynechococcus sp. PP555]
MNEIHCIHGINNKPVDSKALEHALQAISNIHRECFLGYLLPTPEGLSAIENLSSLRKKSQQRQINRPNSRGAKLKQLEDSIATLDHQQHRAVIETIDSVQRIRGLAGSGKTIILALKAAYLHSQHPDWYIAVTFQTRALKGQFKRLINQFCISQTNEEPDWTKVRIVNAWGAKGDEERDGLYYEFCRVTGSEFLDFSTARSRFDSGEKAFDSACQLALDTVTKVPEIYDVIWYWYN